MSASESSPNTGPNPPPARGGALSDQHLDIPQGGEVPLPKSWYDPSMEAPKSLSVISEYIAELSLPRKATHVLVAQCLNVAGQEARIISPEILSRPNEVRYIRNKSRVVGYGDQYVWSVCEYCIQMYWTANQDNTKTKLVKDQIM